MSSNRFLYGKAARLKRLAWLAAVLVLFAVAVGPLAARLSAATPITVGYLDSSYPSGTGSNEEVTAEKPESKLWFNAGSWWAAMWSTTHNAYTIHKLDWATQNWADTGTQLDNRSGTKGDALWDGSKLYYVSHFWAGDGQADAAKPGLLFRYSYAGGVYTLDAGFPVTVSGGTSEALVIEKDTTGRLWVTFVQNSVVQYNYSNASGGGDTNWAGPQTLPVGASASVDSDDLSTLIAYQGRVGIMWSNQTGSKVMYFAVHQDNAAPNVWTVVVAYSASGDDHINLKSLQADPAGQVIAAVKRTGSPLILLLVCGSGDCSSASDWSVHIVYDSSSGSPTRPILLIDTSKCNLYVFVRYRPDGVNAGIYYKSSSMNAISFPSGGGTAFIESATYPSINDPTSTKQNLTAASGLVVLASDPSARVYLHNSMDFSGEPNNCIDLGPPTVAFSSAEYTINEDGAPSATISVSLSRAAGSQVTVNYATSNGSAIAGQDYTPASGILTFGPTDTVQTFNVPILEDAKPEAEETVNLALTTPNGADPGAIMQAVLKIQDDDTLPTVRFGPPNSSSILENAGSRVFNVNLNHAFDGPVSVSYAAGGSASYGGDYTTVPTPTISFAPGQTTRPITVTVTNDPDPELAEIAQLTLYNPVSATLGLPGNIVANLTIQDNDAPPEVRFAAASYQNVENGGQQTISATLSAPSESIVTVDYIVIGSETTAVAGTDYTLPAVKTLTFAPNQTSKTFNVTLLNDSSPDLNKTLTLQLQNPAKATLGAPNKTVLTIIDNETSPIHFAMAAQQVDENAGAAVVNVILDYAADGVVTVNYGIIGGTATLNADYTLVTGMLTFNPGITTRPINLTLLDDLVFEGNETILLKLSAPVGAVVGFPAMTTITIAENEPAPSVAFSAASYVAAESQFSQTITVNLSTMTQVTVTVGYQASDVSTLVGADYQPAAGTLSFPPGTTSTSFGVAIINDATFEPDETADLILSAPVNAQLGAQAQAQLKILDDDVAPKVEFAQPFYEASEGETITVTVQLTATSGVMTSVGYATTTNGSASPNQDFVPVQGTLTFAPGVLEQTFQLSLLDNALQEPPKTVNLILKNAVNAKLGVQNPIDVTINDDESPPVISLSQASYKVTEGETATINVKLSHMATSEVKVSYGITGQTASAGLDFVAFLPGTLTFVPGATQQSFQIETLSDSVDEPPETILIELSNPQQASLGLVGSALLTIEDDNPEPTIVFSNAEYQVSEDGVQAAVRVKLNRASSKDVSVHYATRDGTAVAGLDYEAMNGVLMFPAGETNQNIMVPILADSLAEDDEWLWLALSNPVNATVAPGASEARVTILDDIAIYIPLIIRP